MSSSAPTSRSQRRHDRIKVIVEAAARQFAEHGYSDCDMERVAAAIGIAKGTLYLYFPGKQELFFACVDWGMIEMQRLLFEAAEHAETPLAQISQAVRAYLVFFDEHPEYVELLMQERAMFRNRKKGTYFEHRDEIRPRFRQVYGDLVSCGTLRNDIPVERMMDTIGALLYGTMFINHAAGRALPLDEQHALLMKAAFGGLFTDQGRREWGDSLGRQGESAGGA